MAHKEEVPSYASIKIRGTGRDLFKSILLKNYAGFKLVLDLEGISEEYEFLKRLTIRLPCGEEGNTECQLQYAYQEEMEMSLENPCKELEKEDMKNLTKMLEDFIPVIL